MLTVNIHASANGKLTDLAPERISDTLAQGCELLWVDVDRPTPNDLRLLGEEFSFHPLAIEDASKRHQRPKVDPYDDFLFVVFYAMENDVDVTGPTAGGRLRTVELGLFIGPNYLVTVHDGEVTPLTEVAKRWRENIGLLGQRGVGVLVYSLLDAVVDAYFPVVDAVTGQVDELEVSIFEDDSRDALRDILTMRRDLLALRRVLGPERDVMNVLIRRDIPYFDSATVVYLQDVYDHILRVTDAVDASRELLAGALDAQLSVTSNRLNQTMRTLTASSIILMSMTLVAGVYGMNFVRMPELEWRFGYPFALILMVTVGLVIFGLFRRFRWF
ncbi:MAG: Magnesium and cobalt transport protein CorA [uncultured Thermomicrobiales bacterium]|uniref:Magnesium transport protein CorA n=1 Tax=uncultured Thermomicrobiales bacterium TaxID=1645740 RepID=A0A6J4U570_9BACT|nr:MAG: Magnesium and cobalt transport protein CorA [uncultured Thermomicrobiales bacterium]